jgi:hypothetical protein
MTTAQERVDCEQAALLSFESALRESRVEVESSREAARREGILDQHAAERTHR